MLGLKITLIRCNGRRGEPSYQELPYNSGETFVVSLDRTWTIAAEIHKKNNELRIEGIFKRESSLPDD
jgi:hypothetical protein